MHKNDFLKSTYVRAFIDWIAKRLDMPNSFMHCYQMKKPNKSWECTSVYSAFENYCWPFTYTDPLSGTKIKGSSFSDSLESLSKLSEGLRKSITDSDNEACKNYCLAILEWGGVRANNDKRIDRLEESVCSYLETAIKRFGNDLSSEDYYDNGIIMNSGFTKIYSLCIDDFIIYDGRVGAALGLLVREFCKENGLDKVPFELSFAWGKGKEATYTNSKENKRNPGNEKYSFPELMNNPKRHTENNIRANWLLSEIVNNTDSSFSKLDKPVRMRALESALFMIGYDVKG